MINFKNISDSALKRAVDYDGQTPQQSTNSSASIQQSQPQGTGSTSNMIQDFGGSDGGLAASTVNTNSQYGDIQSIGANRGYGSNGSLHISSKLGHLLGIPGAQPQDGNEQAGQYSSNTSVPNGFGGFGDSMSQSMPNGLAASMYSRGNRFGVNQTIQAPGQYNVIDGAQLI